MIWYFSVGVMMLACGFITFRRRQHIIDTPTALAKSAAIGRAELCGIARGDTVERSPITGKPCAYWEAEILEYQRSLKSRWAVIARETAPASHVWLEDESGRIPVFLYGVHWAMEDDDEFSTNTPLPEGGHAFLERYGFVWNPKHLKVTERRIEEGKPMYVLGTLAESGDVIRTLSDSSLASRMARAAVEMSDAALRATLHQPVRKAEATAGGSNAVSGSAATPPEPGLIGLSSALLDPVGTLQRFFKPHDVVVWCARDGLLISNGDQSKVAKGLLRTTLICLAAGVLMIVLGILS